MPQPLAHKGQVFAVPEHNAGVEVPQVVKADLSHAGPFRQGLESPGYGLGVQGSSQGVCEYQVTLPSAARKGPAPRLSSPLRTPVSGPVASIPP